MVSSEYTGFFISCKFRPEFQGIYFSVPQVIRGIIVSSIAAPPFHVLRANLGVRVDLPISFVPPNQGMRKSCWLLHQSMSRIRPLIPSTSPLLEELLTCVLGHPTASPAASMLLLLPPQGMHSRAAGVTLLMCKLDNVSSILTAF